MPRVTRRVFRRASLTIFTPQSVSFKMSSDKQDEFYMVRVSSVHPYSLTKEYLDDRVPLRICVSLGQLEFRQPNHPIHHTIVDSFLSATVTEVTVDGVVQNWITLKFPGGHKMQFRGEGTGTSERICQSISSMVFNRVTLRRQNDMLANAYQGFLQNQSLLARQMMASLTAFHDKGLAGTSATQSDMNAATFQTLHDISLYDFVPQNESSSVHSLQQSSDVSHVSQTFTTTPSPKKSDHVPPLSLKRRTGVTASAQQPPSKQEDSPNAKKAKQDDK